MSERSITTGSRVFLSYELRLLTGQVVESAGLDDPMEFVMGTQTLVEGLQQRLMGLARGARATFQIQAGEWVFGMPEEDKVLNLPRKDFKASLELERGQVMTFTLSNGEEVLGTVRTINEDNVDVDFNHPLVGRDFIFEVTILAVDESRKTAKKNQVQDLKLTD